MHCRYADPTEIPRLAEARARRLGENIDEKSLDDWLSGERRVVIVENEDGDEAGLVIYRATDDAIELLELSVDGDLAAAFIALREEMWPADARVRVEISADDDEALCLWRKLGFRDVKVILETSRSS